MTFTNMARGKIRARGAHDCVPVDVSRRLTQHLRRLDEHRSRIEYVERTADDVATEVGQLSSRLAAVERRLIELQVANRSSANASAGVPDAVREPVTH
ncbi:MAG: hypothetical protein ACRDO7_02805 [Nocardioidaceae bacterium]